ELERWLTSDSLPPLRDRDLLRVDREPGVEVPELRVELARQLRIARAQEFLAEQRLELEHVPEVIRAREAQRPECIEGNVDEVHLLLHRASHLLRHFGARKDFAGDPEPSARDGRAAPEDTEGRATDVLRSDARELLAAERQGQDQIATLPLSRTEPEIEEVLPVRTPPAGTTWAPLRVRTPRRPLPSRRSAAPCSGPGASGAGGRRAAPSGGCPRASTRPRAGGRPCRSHVPSPRPERSRARRSCAPRSW